MANSELGILELAVDSGDVTSFRMVNDKFTVTRIDSDEKKPLIMQSTKAETIPMLLARAPASARSIASSIVDRHVSRSTDW
jgi:hypothetical protein